MLRRAALLRPGLFAARRPDQRQLHRREEPDLRAALLPVRARRLRPGRRRHRLLGGSAAEGSTARVPVRVINDLDAPWSGDIVLRLVQDDRVLSEQQKAVRAEALELGSAEFDVAFPAEDGTVQLVAEIRGADGQPVRSLRDIQIREVPQNLALGRPVKASSEVRNAQGFFPAALAVDGREDTRWSSEFADNQWLEVDLGRLTTVSAVTLAWEQAHGRAYAIEVSTDGTHLERGLEDRQRPRRLDEIRFTPVEARHVRFRGDRRATPFGFSLWEFEVYGPSEKK